MIRKLLKKLIAQEHSAYIFSASFALGGYIAFSPYLGFHTIMAFGLAWVFTLNPVVVLAASNLINNPWTMIPVYSSGYVVGEVILADYCGLDTHALNPSWVARFNDSLYHYTGLQGVAWWSFMLGGNLLGLLVAGMLYPIMKTVFARFVKSS